MGANGWRTAHNPPNPGLLDAADEMGMLVWDENHRNGQDGELADLVLRDRNHPCVVIWSICNEKLCSTSNTLGDAQRMHGLFHSLDPHGQRPVSANFNGWDNVQTPLDLDGFDYETSTYDKNHKAVPSVPSISSETSSAVSDRCVQYYLVFLLFAFLFLSNYSFVLLIYALFFCCLGQGVLRR